MRDLLRRAFVIATAVAFVISGAAWRHCLAAPPAPVAVASSHGHDVSHHAQHGGHDAHHGEHAAINDATIDADLPAADDHACGKCCSICTITSVSPAAMDTIAVPAVSLVLYGCKADPCRDTTITVDPGIPKRIV